MTGGVVGVGAGAARAVGGAAATRDFARVATAAVAAVAAAVTAHWPRLGDPLVPVPPPLTGIHTQNAVNEHRDVVQLARKVPQRTGRQWRRP